MLDLRLICCSGTIVNLPYGHPDRLNHPHLKMIKAQQRWYQVCSAIAMRIYSIYKDEIVNLSEGPLFELENRKVDHYMEIKMDEWELGMVMDKSIYTNLFSV